MSSRVILFVQVFGLISITVGSVRSLPHSHPHAALIRYLPSQDFVLFDVWPYFDQVYVPSSHARLTHTTDVRSLAA